MKKTEYETPIQNFRRLLMKDDSIKFNILINFENKKNSFEDDNQIKIQTTMNKARVISKKINDIYQIDPTFTTFMIDVSKEKEQKDTYKKIIELIIQSSEETIKIPERKEEEKIFHMTRFLLGDDENIKIITSIEDSLSYLNTEFHDQSIEYLSEHFIDFVSSDKMKKINEEIMKEIIDRYFYSKNKKYNKEEIINIFNKMMENEEESKIIFYFILNLDIDEYNNDIQQYFYDNLNDEILETEFSRILLIIRKQIHKLIEIEQEKKKANERIINCEYSGDELSGIISHFIKYKSPEEVLKTEIKLTGGGIVNQSYPIINLIKYDSKHIDDRYYNRISNTSTEEDSWIQFDFGEKRINLTSYTIRSNGVPSNTHAHPKSWKISGSNDGEHWELINKQINNQDLNGIYKQHRFECENNNFYRFIQYKQDDSWDSNQNFRYTIYISCFELFGSILKIN